MKFFARCIVGGIFLLAGSLAQADTFSVRAFGAKGDDQADDSQAFQKAIDAASADGKGFEDGPSHRPQAIVEVPAGTYRLQNVYLKSNVRLEVSAAVIFRPLACDDPTDRADIFWLDGKDAALENVTLIGVGESMEGKPKPVAGWDISHSFTFDLDSESNHGPVYTHGIALRNVDGFLIENVFSIQNNKKGDHTPPTSHTAVMVFKYNTKSKWGGPWLDPRHGSVVNHYNIHSPAGFGPNQLASAHDLVFRNIFSEGGTALRLETDAAEAHSKKTGKDFTEIASEIDGLVAENIECHDGNRAVAFSPHSQANRNVTVRGVKAVSCNEGIKVAGNPKGTFDNSTVTDVLVIAGDNAQIKTASGNEWTRGRSTAPVTQASPAYKVEINNLKTEGF